MAGLVDDPAVVTIEQMDSWCADFDSWAICDTVCFTLFDRAPGAWSRLEPWAADEALFVRRASFALLWSLALHDRAAPDDGFRAALDLVEQYATDERPLVGKSISMALRAVGRRDPGPAGGRARDGEPARRLRQCPGSTRGPDRSARLPLSQRGSRRPLARRTGRSTAARMASSVPMTRTCSRARVTAV